MPVTAQYQEDGSILASWDGKLAVIPDEPTNRDRIRLAQWEANGGVIQPYVPPDTSAEDARKAAYDADVNMDGMYKRLKSASPEQIEDWINANMTNLAQARVVVATILKMLAARL